MPPRQKKKKTMRLILLGIAAVSLISFLYLNVCQENTIIVSDYLANLSYSDFKIELEILPDLNFFENSIERIMRLILASV